MSMLKKIKSLFVVEDMTQAAATKETEGKQKEEISSGGSDAGAASSVKANKASLDQFLKVLAGAMEASNQAGYDYLEFKQAVRSLSELESEEEKRFITAYTLARTMGAEKEALKKSAAHYLKVLDLEKNKFNQSLQNQIDSRLITRKQSIESLEQKKLQKIAQLEKLKEELTGIDQKLVSMKEEIEASSKKVETVRVSFHKAYELIVQQIGEDVEKIEKYIK